MRSRLPYPCSNWTALLVPIKGILKILLYSLVPMPVITSWTAELMTARAGPKWRGKPHIPKKMPKTTRGEGGAQASNVDSRACSVARQPPHASSMMTGGVRWY